MNTKIFVFVFVFVFRIRGQLNKNKVNVHGCNICATQGAPLVPSSMVLQYIHPVSAVPSILVLTLRCGGDLRRPLAPKNA